MTDDGWMQSRMHDGGQVDKWMNTAGLKIDSKRWIDGGSMVRLMKEGTERLRHEWLNEWMDGLIKETRGEWIVREMNGWLVDDGQMKKWMEGDGRKDEWKLMDDWSLNGWNIRWING